MRKTFLRFLLLLVFVLGGNLAFAQTQQQKEKKILADNVSYARQSQLLDSVIARLRTDKLNVRTENEVKENQLKEETDAEEEILSMEDFGEIPASDLYDGAWGTQGVNDFRAELENVPDSIMFDCAGYVQPIPEAHITSVFGPRRYRYHYGTDFRVKRGDPIGSAFDGKVRITSYDARGYGNYVVVRHNNGLETVYGHLSSITVLEGENVVAGQCIGLGGNTGRSTGPHLHFETRFLGNPINPETLFDFSASIARHDQYFMVKSVAFAHVAEANALKAKAAAARYHKVRSGDSLSRIAVRYGTTITKLCRLNRIGRNTALRIGQRIRYN